MKAVKRVQTFSFLYVWKNSNEDIFPQAIQFRQKFIRNL